jgi:hypothetical protein
VHSLRLVRVVAAFGLLAVLLLAGLLFVRGRSRPEAEPSRLSAGDEAATPSIPTGLGKVETFPQSDALPPAAWVEAAEAIVRLPPDAFPDLPVSIRVELQRRGCTVPQTYADQRPHNVIRGRFTSAEVTDWAVLCSYRGESSVLVFQSTDGRPVAELAKNADAEYLQHGVAGVGSRTIGFSRAIGVAGQEEILQDYERHGGPKPRRLTHDGIGDAFIEKASAVHYWDDGTWLQLLGSD